MQTTTLKDTKLRQEEAKRKYVMKHKICFLVAVFAAVTCFGCSAGVNQNNVSNDMPAVLFKNSEKTTKEKRLENDYIRIWCKSITRGVFCTVVENLDGSNRQEFEGDEFAGRELWLTNDWFYYYMDGPKLSQDTIYRAPISYENNKAEIHFKKREKLFEGKDLDGQNVLITDSCIIYCDYDDQKTTSTYYQYDLETKEVSELFDIPDEAPIVENVENGLPMIFQNSFFITTTGAGDRSVYSVSLDTLEKRVLQENVPKEKPESDMDYYLPNEGMTEYGGAVYFAPEGNQVMRYEGENEPPGCVLSEQSLHQIMDTWNLWENKASHLQGTITHVYACNGRLYLIVYAEWDQKEKVGDRKEKIIKRNYSRDILISAAFSNLDQWELEETFTNYIWEKAKCDKGYNKENNTYYCFSDNIIRRMGGGGILFWLTPASRQKEGKTKTILYDLASRKFQTLDGDINNYLCWDVRPPY